MTTIKHGEWLQERAPDKIGAGEWRAWSIQASPSTPDQAATVSAWLLYCPGAHVVWSYWMLGVIHLRPIDGVRPPVILRDGASHELMIVALDPTYAPPDPVGWGGPIHYLTPVDVVEQFRVRDDAQARRLANSAVRALMSGTVSPDQDWRTWWQKSVAATAAHFLHGEHLDEPTDG